CEPGRLAGARSPTGRDHGDLRDEQVGPREGLHLGLVDLVDAYEGVAHDECVRAVLVNCHDVTPTLSTSLSLSRRWARTSARTATPSRTTTAPATASTNVGSTTSTGSPTPPVSTPSPSAGPSSRRIEDPASTPPTSAARTTGTSSASASHQP